MSRELRKDPKPRRPFEQAEARSQSQSAISPIKRPAKRRQQSATQADEAVDAAIAMVQIRKTVRAFQQREQPSQPIRSSTPPHRPPEGPPPSDPITVSPNSSHTPNILDSPPPSSHDHGDEQEEEDDRPKWTIEWSVFIGKQRVYDEVLDGEKFEEYQDYMVKKGFREAGRTFADGGSQALDWEFNRPIIHAKFSAKGTKPYFQTYQYRDDGLEPRTARNLFNRVDCLHEEGKKDIRVQIEQRLAVVGPSDGFLSASQNQQNEGRWGIGGLPAGTPFAAHRGVAEPISSQPTSRRQRHLDLLNAADKATGNHITALEMRWKCRAGTCRNFDRCCFPFGNVGHVILTNQTLIKWNEAIRDNKATLDMPPSGVLGDLVAAQAKGKGQQTTPGSSWQMNSGMGMGGLNLNLNLGQTNSDDKLVQRDPEPESSPPRIEGDEDSLLTKYIDWLIVKRPAQEMQLERARDALEKEGWGFFDLKHKITDEDWRTMKIGNGTVYTIKKRLKEWPGPKDNSYDDFEL
jgi:hypothetical protein